MNLYQRTNMRIHEIASNAKYRKDEPGSKFGTTKCRMIDISESQNCDK